MIDTSFVRILFERYVCFFIDGILQITHLDFLGTVIFPGLAASWSGRQLPKSGRRAGGVSDCCDNCTPQADCQLTYLPFDGDGSVDSGG